MRKMNIFSLAIMLYSLTSCSNLFQGKVAMINHSTGSLGSLFSEKDVICQLDAPKQIFASQYMSGDRIKLSWQESTGASSYVVARAISEPDINGNYTEPEAEEYEIIEQFVYNTKYEDVIEKSNSTDVFKNKYYYKVYAENKRLSYESSLFTEAVWGCLFSNPTNVKASLGVSTDKITVSWNAVEGASTYSIYRSTNSNGTSAELIGTVTSNMKYFNNAISSSEQGIEFYYYVVANNSYGNSSSASSLAIGYTLMAGAPSKPNNVIVTSGKSRGDSKSSIELSWSAVPAESSVTYNIYRTSSVDSSYTLLSSTNSTSYIDTKSLKQNIYYYYQIQAVTTDSETGDVLKGPFSDSGSDSASPAEGFILSCPSSVVATKAMIGGVEYNYLQWPSAIGSETEKASWTYKIYGCNSKDGDYSLIDTVTETSASEGVVDSYIKHKTSSNCNFYKITTVNASGVESAESVISSPVPFAAEKVKVTVHENISSSYASQEVFLSKANSSGVLPVKITWEKPSNDEPYAYNVYRSTLKDSGFRKINTDPIPNTTFSYIDENETAKAGKIYYYRVLSLNSLEQGGYYSETASGYGALSYEQYMIEYNKTVKASQKKLTLMHLADDMKKLGQETVNGTISGSLSYNAAVDGLGAKIVMRYESYADFYIDNNVSNGVYFCVTGNTDTKASMDASGSMSGTVDCVGMYPGKVYYENIKIKGGAAGGGTYGIEPEGFSRKEIDYLVGEI